MHLNTLRCQVWLEGHLHHNPGKSFLPLVVFVKSLGQAAVVVPIVVTTVKILQEFDTVLE